jgi:hypothetical protein
MCDRRDRWVYRNERNPAAVVLGGDAVLDTLAQRDRLSSCAASGVDFTRRLPLPTTAPQKNNNPVN